MNVTPLWFPSTKNDTHHLRFVQWDFAKGFVIVDAPTGCHRAVVLETGWPYTPPADVKQCPTCASVNAREMLPQAFPPL